MLRRPWRASRQSHQQGSRRGWRDRVALTHSPGVPEEWFDLAFNVNRSLASLDQLHESRHHHPPEAFTQKDFLEEVPVNSIENFLEVEFNKQSLLLLRVKLVCNLV
jgi:hypothetical protein